MVEEVYRAFGRAHDVVHGRPWILVEPGYQKLVDLLDRHLPGLARDERDRIMGGTALDLWFRRQAGPARSID